MTPVTPKTVCNHGDISDLSDDESVDKQAVRHPDEPFWKNQRDNVLKANQDDMKNHRLPGGHFDKHELGTSAPMIVNNTYHNCSFDTTNVVNQTGKRTTEKTNWGTTPEEREAKRVANWRAHIAKFKFPPPKAPEPDRAAKWAAHIAKFKFPPPPAPKPATASKEFVFPPPPVPKPAPTPKEFVFPAPPAPESTVPVNKDNDTAAEPTDDEDIAAASEENENVETEPENEENVEAEPENEEDIETEPEDTPISAARRAWQKRRWGKHLSFNRLIHRWNDDNMYLAWDGARPAPTVYDDYERHVTRSNGEWPYLHMSPRDLRALFNGPTTSTEVKTLIGDVIGTDVVNFTIRNPAERQTYYDYPNWSSSSNEPHDIMYE
jgi:hypothetical protein